MKRNRMRFTAGHRQGGVTLVEIMVALAIGSFLMIGAIQVYNQSRQAYVINDSIARVQETAQFAIDTIEADLRMASNWGLNSRGVSVDGRAIVGNVNPLNIPNVPNQCGLNWVLDLAHPLDGSNNAYNLPCAPNGGAQANSDVVTVRRGTVATTVPAAGRMQVQTTRTQGQIFNDGAVPAAIDPLESETHDLLVNSYYVSPTSTLIPGVPTLRRKTLGLNTVDDQEVAPGVENLQVLFGVDVDSDNTVDRYVNPGDAIFIPGNAAYIPGARVITARVWLLVRSLGPEVGLTDNRDYEPGDVDLGTPNDQMRRLMISKTILLRNARS